MSVDLRASTSVKIDDVEGDPSRFQQDIGERTDSWMVDLRVVGGDELVAVFTDRVRQHIWRIIFGASLHISCSKVLFLVSTTENDNAVLAASRITAYFEMRDDAVLDALVIERLHERIFSVRRVDEASAFAKQVIRFISEVNQCELVIASKGDDVVERFQACFFFQQFGLVSQAEKRLKVAEGNRCELISRDGIAKKKETYLAIHIYHRHGSFDNASISGEVPAGMVRGQVNVLPGKNKICTSVLAL